MKEEQKLLMEVVENTSRVIQGKSSQIQMILATWLAGGHVLLEDVPGTGKTVLAKALGWALADVVRSFCWVPHAGFVSSTRIARPARVVQFCNKENCLYMYCYIICN